MTRPRPAGSFEEALWLTLGGLGLDQAAAATGRLPGYLRDASIEDRPQQLCLPDAVKLDLAWRASGRDGAPLYETYGVLLDVANAERFADADALARHLVRVLKEGGEANLALALSCSRLAGPLQHRETVRELTDLRRAVDSAIADARRMAGLGDEQPP